MLLRREQTYWKPEALAAPVAVVITKSLQTKPQPPPILVLVLFVLSHLLSDLSCPNSASAAMLAVKRTMRMTTMVRIVSSQNNARTRYARQRNKRPVTSVTGLSYAGYAVWMRIIPLVFSYNIGQAFKV